MTDRAMDHGVGRIIDGVAFTEPVFVGGRQPGENPHGWFVGH
jgi:hypothetical protein